MNGASKRILPSLPEDWPVDGEFCLRHCQPAMEKALNRVSGSRVYEKEKEAGV